MWEGGGVRCAHRESLAPFDRLRAGFDSVPALLRPPGTPLRMTRDSPRFATSLSRPIYNRQCAPHIPAPPAP